MKLSTSINALYLSLTKQAEVLHEVARSLPVVPMELITRIEAIEATAKKLQSELDQLQDEPQYFNWPVLGQNERTEQDRQKDEIAELNLPGGRC